MTTLLAQVRSWAFEAINRWSHLTKT